ncbi:MAG: hypothetical protein HXY47_01945 [Nitrospirae bacterium]|nr:hypothetical protein [Nitrospirota bacterium]
MKGKIIIGLFLTALIVTFLGPIADIDFPFHLKTGEYIYEHKMIPKDDPFTFHGKGILTDKEIFMLSQYWLAQVIFYKLYTIAGPTGIILLKSIIFSAYVFLLWFVLRKRGLYSSLLIALLITVALLPYKLDRPQYFSFLFALVLISLFEKFRETPYSFKPLLFIPPLMLLWSNMHAGFIFGLVVIFIYALIETLKYFAKRITPSLPIGQPLSEKAILILLAACLLAIVFSSINPNGHAGLIRVITAHTSSKWLFTGIREYMSPLEEARYPYASFESNISFWILFGMTCVLIALNTIRKKSIDITIIAIVFFTSFAALTTLRYVPLFIATAIPLTKNYRVFKGTPFFRRLNTSPIMSVIFSLFFIFATVYGLKDYKHIFSFRAQHFYPEKAVTFLLENHIEANMFNSANRGSYLIFKLYPYYKVFQDSRYITIDATIDGYAIRDAQQNFMQPGDLALGSALSALVPEEFGKIEISTQNQFSNPENTKPYWKRLLGKYNIDLIVHEATADYTGQIFPLTLRLLKDNEWVLIYLDGSVQIFVRNTEKYAEIIKKFRKPKELVYDEIILETAPLVKTKTTFSMPYSSLAFALMMKGLDAEARKMINAALELNEKDLVANFCNAYLALREKNKSKS